MKHLNLKNAIALLLLMSVMLFYLFSFVQNVTPDSALQILKILSQVWTAVSLIAGVFIYTLWKHKIFQGWLVKVPNLQGTWTGEIISDWVEPGTGKTQRPIPAVLTIKQSLFFIHFAMTTRESRSNSIAADFDIDKDHQRMQVSYLYDNKSDITIKSRNPFHCGAIVFTIVHNKKQYRLQGEYWTDRKTTGKMNMEFHSSKLTDDPRRLLDDLSSGPESGD